ncbi:Styrene monooxygenase StyA [Anaerolineae bacterium]|nr:Styrene monooxygenase StyA [Anaerolineae bacterium]
MRRIAIIGSGQAGLINAHALLKAGYEVSLYSDRTGQQWLTEGKPTGTAVRFPIALAYERELGLDFWNDSPAAAVGVNFVLCLQPGTPFLVLNGRFDSPALAVDLRLQSSRWMEAFEKRGGKLHIEKITIERLDAISAEHDLTIVASGKGALSDLFPVDEKRSIYTKPQRHLSMVNVINANDNPNNRVRIARYYELPKAGETVWTPYHHMTHGSSWNLFSEAREGGPLDIFRDAKSGEDVLDRFKQLIRKVYPWDWEWAKDMKLADPNGWLTGEIKPTIRKPVGILPSGRPVTFVGDAGMAFDPVGAQGANNGNKMARHLTEAIVKRGSAPFDAAWIEATFDDFYHSHGEPAYRFNNAFLDGLPLAGQEILAAQYGSDGRADNLSPAQKLANEFCANFSDPRYLTDALLDVSKARKLISTHTGEAAMAAVMKGRFAIIGNLIRWWMSSKKADFGFQHQMWS